MDIFEITGYKTGVDQSGVNYLQPSDSFQNIQNGFIYRQVLQSRQGAGFFAPRLAGQTRIMGIFEHQLPDSSKQLLVADMNFLYKYNAITHVFDQIPFGGSMAGYTGFNLAGAGNMKKWQYISGTSYPTATNTPRFIICGEGIEANASGSSIFFYDGTNVKDYTNVADNPNYAPPIDPTTLANGQLKKAHYVFWFNERLNFAIPTISAIEYNQGVLFSGIRSGTGNGDKFNVPGSGLFQADTYQNITGVSILGKIVALNFDRMTYTLEKTTDAFNPYLGRSVPGPLGTNAKFSAVAWADTVISFGKTGILSTDGRQNLRIDNKIPYFTAQNIDQGLFKLTYGGFDRQNNQFLWSYKISGSDSETQNSILVYNYEESTWSVYDERFSTFGQSDIGANFTWDEIDDVTSGIKSWKKWKTTEEIWDEIGLADSVQKTLAGDDLGFIYDLNQDFDDYYSDISAIATGSTTTLTIDASAFLPGDLVTVSDVEGMLDIEGNSGINNYNPDDDTENFIPYVVLSSTPTSVTINLDSTLLTAYTLNTGSVSKVISFSAETIPFNPYRDQGRRCYISLVEFLIENNGGNLRVDVFADQQDTPFKQNILLAPNVSAQANQWLEMSVNQEANFFTFLLKQQSPGAQLRLTSMRIHAKPGGKTSG